MPFSVPLELASCSCIMIYDCSHKLWLRCTGLSRSLSCWPVFFQRYFQCHHIKLTSDLLEKEASIAITGLDRNEMIAYPENFQALLVKKDRTETTRQSISIQGKTIKSEDSVKLLGVNLNQKLKFDLHISDICKKAATQLNVLKRLKSFFGFAE